MCPIITHVKVQISNHSAYGPLLLPRRRGEKRGDNAHRFDIVFRESVSQPANGSANRRDYLSFMRAQRGTMYLLICDINVR